MYNIQDTIKPEESFSLIRWHIILVSFIISIKTVDVTTYKKRKANYLNRENEEELEKTN